MKPDIMQRWSIHSIANLSLNTSHRPTLLVYSTEFFNIASQWLQSPNNSPFPIIHSRQHSPTVKRCLFRNKAPFRNISYLKRYETMPVIRYNFSFSEFYILLYLLQEVYLMLASVHFADFEAVLMLSKGR